MKIKKLISFVLSFVLIFMFVVCFYFIFYKKQEGVEEANDQEKARLEEVELGHADMLSYLRRYQEAEKEYRHFLHLKPNCMKAKLNLAKVLYYENKNDEALNLLKEVPLYLNELKNEDCLCVRGSGFIDRNQLNIRKIKSFTIDQSSEHWHEPKSDSSGCLGMDEIEEDMNLLIADIHLSRGDYGQAELLYREYLEAFPDNSHAQLNLAKVLSWEKKYEPSIELYQTLLDKNPDNTQIRRQYSRVLIWMGRYEQGAEELKRTL